MDPECVNVRLSKGAYKIWVSCNWLSKAGKMIRQIPELRFIKEAMVFTSPNIGGLYFRHLEQSLKNAGFNKVYRHDIPDGERNKNFEQYEKCLNALATSFKLPESLPLVINLGGGVVGDMGGFAAATFRRGVPYVQIPTTLLGFVDCGIGGKVDINYHGIKNLIGQFYQPKLVFDDLILINTLEARQVRSGIAEVVKYGAVCSRGLFEYLEDKIEDLSRLCPQALTRVTMECAGIKARIVAKDEKDAKGVRIVLNFGHTVGHALETEADFKMTHGEAISVGMVAATKLAVKLKVCAEEVCERLVALLQRAKLPIHARGLELSADRILSRMKHDKKFVGGRNLFVLPTSIGSWRKREGIGEGLIRKIVLDLI